MHRLVFENREDGFGAVEEPISGSIDVRMKERVDDALVSLCRKCPHRFARRPSRGIV